MSKLQPARGTRDLLPAQNQVYRFIEETAYKTAVTYGFSEIETPIFEFSEVFHRTLGETSDMVSKETYDFKDRGGDSITLRPEGTAGVARAFISEGLAQSLPLKLYYSGPMFRYERPQKGRYRQFNQLGIEYLGAESPWSDVEVLGFASDFLKAIGLEQNYRLEINTLGDKESRARYREHLVEYFSKYEKELSADSQLRLKKNPLRILDSKDEADKKIVAAAPHFENDLNDASKLFFSQVQNGLGNLGIDFKVNQKLVRGIDYYCHTVFEFITENLGAQGTLLAGGRYDGLIETMGGPKTPGVGWAAGIDRLMELVPNDQLPSARPKVAFVAADEAGESAILKLAHMLRPLGYVCEIPWGGNMGKKMKKAAAGGAQYALILGESEVKSSTVMIKNLSTGEQKSLPQLELATFFARS
jgi:histidyl-tRNA synthetase